MNYSNKWSQGHVGEKTCSSVCVKWFQWLTLAVGREYHWDMLGVSVAEAWYTLLHSSNDQGNGVLYHIQGNEVLYRIHSLNWFNSVHSVTSTDPCPSLPLSTKLRWEQCMKWGNEIRLFLSELLILLSPCFSFPIRFDSNSSAPSQQPNAVSMTKRQPDAHPGGKHYSLGFNI